MIPKMPQQQQITDPPKKAIAKTTSPPEDGLVALVWTLEHLELATQMYSLLLFTHLYMASSPLTHFALHSHKWLPSIALHDQSGVLAGNTDLSHIFGREADAVG